MADNMIQIRELTLEDFEAEYTGLQLFKQISFDWQENMGSVLRDCLALTLRFEMFHMVPIADIGKGIALTSWDMLEENMMVLTSVCRIVEQVVSPLERVLYIVCAPVFGEPERTYKLTVEQYDMDDNSEDGGEDES